MHPTTVARGALAAALIGAGALSVTACSQPTTPGSSAIQGPAARAGSATPADAAGLDVETAALVSNPGDPATGPAQQQRRHAARDRLARALHATWVTSDKRGTITHQAIRGEVSAVSPTSVTVKAKDGFSQTFTVGADTTVKSRNLSATDRAGRRAADASLATVTVGSRAFVVGAGASGPVASRIVVLTGQRPAKAPKTARTPSSPSTATPTPSGTPSTPSTATPTTPTPTTTTATPTATSTTAAAPATPQSPSETSAPTSSS